MKVALYARVSTLDQDPESQLLDLRRYCTARGWTFVEFVDHGVSGAKDRRPQLDAMLAAVKRKHYDAVVCWKLDRLGRNMRHLVTLLDDFRALDVGFITVGEGLDTTTSAGRLIFGIIASVAEFERERIRERILLSIKRRKERGDRMGRPKLHTIVDGQAGKSHARAAEALGVSVSTVRRRRKEATL